MLTCRDCGREFAFTVGEQHFFAEKGLVNLPHRCPACRIVARRVRAATPKDYHAVVCSLCGAQAMVPFAPRTDRPVYCSTCFDRVRAADRSQAPPDASKPG